MKYRPFGQLDWEVSALGFGAMRLPVIGDDPAAVDEDEAIRMIRYAIDHGVNYVDTAYPYHEGASERCVGKALQDGYRERVRLATKLPSWLIERVDDCDRILDEQLERLQTESVEFYLLHGLNKVRWPSLQALDVLSWAEKAMGDGRIQNLGFSFHDGYEVFESIVDASDLWVLAQIQYNYMDAEYQAGTKGLAYAANKGLAVVVMEPLRGGRITQRVPPTVQAIWDNSPVQRLPAQWALDWVWNQPAVSVALSGMSTMDQVEQNVAWAARSAVGVLTDDELEVIARVRDAYEALCPIPCTDCKYCLPCPSGVSIPRVFEIYNDFVIYGDLGRSQMVYSWLGEDERANLCTECGECLEKCPQHIDIPPWLEKAHEVLRAEL
jgi:predicted aldo/keto reductase-like oxidoreductase